jgi:hypothetical protein
MRGGLPQGEGPYTENYDEILTRDKVNRQPPPRKEEHPTYTLYREGSQRNQSRPISRKDEWDPYAPHSRRLKEWIKDQEYKPPHEEEIRESGRIEEPSWDDKEPWKKGTEKHKEQIHGLEDNRKPHGRRPKVRPPESFSGKGEELPEFEKQLRRYAAYNEVDERAAAEMIPFYIKEEAMDFYNSIPKKDTRNMDEVFRLMRERFCPASFKLIQHEKFLATKQKEDEDIENYIARFNKYIRILELPESHAIAQFTNSLIGPLKEDVMILNPETLPKAFERARIKAAAMQHSQNPLHAQIARIIALQEAQLDKNAQNKGEEREETIAMLQEERIRNIVREEVDKIDRTTALMETPEITPLGKTQKEDHRWITKAT